MFDILKKIWSILNPKERITAVLIFVLMIFSAALEIVGIGLIMPVIALLSKPELIDHNRFFKIIHDFVNPESTKSFIIILSVSLIILYILKNIFMMWFTLYQSKFIFNKTSELSNKLYENYINARYSFHLKNNSTHLLNNLNQISGIGIGILLPFMILLTEGIVAFSIILLLFLMNPIITLSVSGIGSVIIATSYLLLKKINYQLGERIRFHGAYVFQFAMQGFEAIKECKVRNKETYFCNEYRRHLFLRNDAMALSNAQVNYPRFFIEALVIVIGLSTLIILLEFGNTNESALLTLSLFSVCLLRIMPSMSRIQYNMTIIRQNLYTFNELYHDLTSFQIDKRHNDGDPIVLNDTILIDNISFSYRDESTPIFKDYSLSIKKYSSVVFMGTTGSGKTTLIDIILGLLKPHQGVIRVDGRNIEENISSWQIKIGYVPQFIYLMDSTIKNNVAFGVKPEEINDERVRECLKTAQIIDFIDSQKDRLNTMVGEKGVRLSGGQRQRIGIARALYHQPEVLILDEATSALDNETEKAFIDAVNVLKGKITIIMIAHHLASAKHCDRIIEINGLNKD
ncbi:MAG: hypothetical protein A2X48_04445 [Lentisphaerae bacterium GWF2_49_21]|nr:MAG: hypothetical protein A2X48_04445 [Lentisphaerae bacterium GWF2_49_21]